MLSAYEQYAAEVGIIEMPAGYYAEKEVGKKSLFGILKPRLPYLVFLVGCVIAFLFWRRRR